MRKIFMLFLATGLIAATGYAAQTGERSQSSASASAQSDTKSQAEVKSKPGDITLDAGTQIQAEMSSTLDLKKAKPGDSFKMKTSRPVKRDGKEIISRGSIITGHIEQITRADNTTSATLVFDQIQDKKTKTMSTLEATIMSVTRADAVASLMKDDEMMRPPARNNPPARGGQKGGGLVGGVVDTVGGVTGQVGATVDSTTRSTVGVDSGLGQTAGGLSRGTIQIVTDTTATTTSGSTLSLAGRDSKIDSHTQFILQTASALTLTKEKSQNRK